MIVLCCFNLKIISNILPPDDSTFGIKVYASKVEIFWKIKSNSFCFVQSFVEKLITMKETLCQNCHLDKTTEPSALDFAVISDRGYLLWLSLEVAVAVQSVDAKSIAFLKKHLDFWTKSYNYR